jgi:hypothetical protein
VKRKKYSKHLSQKANRFNKNVGLPQKNGRKKINALNQEAKGNLSGNTPIELQARFCSPRGIQKLLYTLHISAYPLCIIFYNQPGFTHHLPMTSL